PQTGLPSGHVLVVAKNPDPKATHREVQGLADLQLMNLPVIPVQSIGTFRGQSARMMPLMVKVDLHDGSLLQSPYATRGTLESLQGKVWSKRVDRDEAAGYKERLSVISDKLIAGKPMLHVLSDVQPDAGFEVIQPDLEDVYFSYIFGSQPQLLTV
ncbi:MAG: hypothetical protein V4581_04875, partial [Bacteroidota bacterium]